MGFRKTIRDMFGRGEKTVSTDDIGVGDAKEQELRTLECKVKAFTADTYYAACGNEETHQPHMYGLIYQLCCPGLTVVYVDCFRSEPHIRHSRFESGRKFVCSGAGLNPYRQGSWYDNLRYASLPQDDGLTERIEKEVARQLKEQLQKDEEVIRSDPEKLAEAVHRFIFKETRFEVCRDDVERLIAFVRIRTHAGDSAEFIKDQLWARYRGLFRITPTNAHDLVLIIRGY